MGTDHRIFETLAAEHATDLITIADPDGTRLYISPAAVRVLGHQTEDLIGDRIATLCHPEDWGKLRGAMAALRRGSDHEVIEVRLLTSSGAYIWCESTVRAIRDPDTGALDLVVAVTRDISERKRAQGVMALLRAVVTAANRAVDVESPLRVALREVAGLTGWELGHVYLTDNERLLPTGWWYASAAAQPHLEVFRTRLDIPLGPGERLAGRVLAEGKAHWITDLDLDRAVGPFDGGPHLPVRGAVAFPVLVGEQVVAVLEFLTLAPPNLEPEVLDAMAQVGLELGRVFERQRAVAAERHKVEAEHSFLAMLTHDLRSPLTAVVGFAELLQAGWRHLPAAKTEHYVEQIVGQASRIRALIDDFLLTARLESGVLEPDLEPVDLAGAARVAVGKLGDVVGEVEIRDDSQGVHAQADRRFVRQILDNLLTNAAKYGEPPITVEARAVGGGWIELCVCDHGPGVPRESVAAIFDRFARGDRDRHSGTGLGLAIVRELARSLGGDVGYQDREPCGARFTVRLPVAAPAGH